MAVSLKFERYNPLNGFILATETLAVRHSSLSALRPEQREILPRQFKSPVILSVVEL